MLFITLPDQRALSGEEAGIGNWANVAWLKIDAGGPRVGFQGRWAQVRCSELHVGGQVDSETKLEEFRFLLTKFLSHNLKKNPLQTGTFKMYALGREHNDLGVCGVCSIQCLLI